MEKVIRDGKVAVLISKGYGCGWYTAHGMKELVFHPKLVDLVEKGLESNITEDMCKDLLGLTDEEDYVCTLGTDGLSIVWLDEGTAFIVNEYDGAESITTLDNFDLVA